MLKCCESRPSRCFLLVQVGEIMYADVTNMRWLPNSGIAKAQTKRAIYREYQDLCFAFLATIKWPEKQPEEVRFEFIDHGQYRNVYKCMNSVQGDLVLKMQPEEYAYDSIDHEVRVSPFLKDCVLPCLWSGTWVMPSGARFRCLLQPAVRVLGDMLCEVMSRKTPAHSECVMITKICQSTIKLFQDVVECDMQISDAGIHNLGWRGDKPVFVDWEQLKHGKCPRYAAAVAAPVMSGPVHMEVC